MSEEERPRREAAGWIQSAREAHGLTVDQFADMLGVNPRTVRAWEAGRDPIPYRVPGQVREALVDPTDRIVAALIADDLEAVPIYRDDDTLRASVHGVPDFAGARWWRHVAWRVHKATGVPMRDM